MSVTTKTSPPVHGQTIEWRDGKLTVPGRIQVSKAGVKPPQ